MADTRNDQNEKQSPADIHEAASEWIPDAQEASSEMEQQMSGEEKPVQPEESHEVSREESIEKPAAPSSPGPVAFVADPFGMSALNVRESQRNEDEIIDEDLELASDESESSEAEDVDAIDMAQLRGEMTEETASDDAPASEEDTLEAGVEDQDPAAVDDELARVAAAVQEEEKKHEQELQALAPDDEAEAAARLAKEIAEDEALERASQQEAEEAEALDPELAAALPKEPRADEHGNLDLAELESCIEALLFMTDKPMSLEKIQELLGPDFSHALFQEAMTSLRDRYNRPHHGIELVEVAGGIQFRTKPGRAALAKKLAKVQTQRLSSGAMETLAIVAYKQPVLKEDVDKIRGVDSSHFIRGLLDKKLVRISGRSDLPGRPMLYSTTSEFLELFGLKDLAAMPSLRELEQMIPSSQSRNPEDEDPRVKEMRRLVGEMKADTSTSLIYDPKEDEKFLKDIREKVNSIATTTPYLEQQRLAEKEAAEAAKAGGDAAAQPPVIPGLEGMAPIPAESSASEASPSEGRQAN